MTGSIKSSILNYYANFPLVRVHGRSPLPHFQAKRLKIQRLSFSLLFPAFWFLHSLTVVSVAATPQIAQVNSTTTNINRPTLKIGSQGERVSELQAALKLLGFYTGAVDGVYNNITASAVSRFKQSVGLNPDGVVDASTWQHLFPNESIAASSVSSPNSASKFPVPPETSNTPKVANSSPQPRPATPNTTTSKNANPSPQPRPAKPNTTTSRNANASSEPRPATPSTSTNSQKPSVPQSSPTRSQSTISHPTIQYTSEGLPILRVGMHGPEVVKLQQRLQRLGFFEGNIDGDFGAKTEAAVKAAQQRYDLEADGVVGGGTWAVLTRRR
ncbi:MAG: peptidoglycan-binding protein [Stigonema ocellatum SAG 48.90 = DSM 106950]|nr:peptidoglycan-binding protein [Stigonema ocellatum SAG 48.90 = DSM 106950]